MTPCERFVACDNVFRRTRYRHIELILCFLRKLFPPHLLNLMFAHLFL
jgi:hypothetical protein